MTPIFAYPNRRWGQLRRARECGGHDLWLGWARRRGLFRSPQPRRERALRPDLLDTVLRG